MKKIDQKTIQNAAPASPSTGWKEVVEADEQALFEKFGREIRDWQEEIAHKAMQPPLRGFHAKLHAGLMAEFQVLAGLPPYARFGVFAEPGVFQTVVRFSNGESAPHRDSHPEPRGIAIKLIGVPGRKLLAGQEDAVTRTSWLRATRSLRQSATLGSSSLSSGHHTNPARCPSHWLPRWAFGRRYES